jgi:hypothetical protein
VSSHLDLYTVFDHPSDFPDYYVVRRFRARAGIVKNDLRAYCFKELAMAREFIQQQWPHAVCLGRAAGDDPKILETWL